MRYIFCFLFILGISVVYLSQDVEGMSQQRLVAQYTEPFHDYDEQVITDRAPVGDYCSREHQDCELNSNYTVQPICVYKKNTGLTNFFGLCTINLHLCLKTHKKNLQDGSASLGDEIYYNGKSFDCQYYEEYVKSERQGIIWYFKLGGLNAETEEITQPFEKIL